jgi:hypothetical protein
MGQRIRFPLLTPKVICDNKPKSRQGQCPLSLALIQNKSCHEILQVLIDAPPSSLMDLAASPKKKTMEGKGIGTHSLARSTSRVKGRIGT